MISKLLVPVAAAFLTVTAQAAYFQADLPAANVNPALGTQVIIAGKGLEVGDQWLRAAHTQALLFKDKASSGSIRVIGAIENSRTLTMLSNWGYKNVKVFEQTFTGSRLNDLLKRTGRIASMDWIGHNGAVLGFVLEDYSNRYFLDDARALSGIAGQMTADSYVRVMGCNTGWNLAPAMAKALRVPVAGTFTFADIQKLHETKEWFYHDEGRYPGGKFLKRNELSYVTPINCEADGGCLRLKPVHIAYQGKHGNYGGTVPFIKYFCGDLAASDCNRRMAISLLQFASTTSFASLPTEGQFQEILADHFCPGVKDLTKRQACRQAIRDHVSGTRALAKTFTTSSGHTLSCTMKSCEVKMDCSGGSCIMVGTGKPGTSTIFVDELNAYVQGFRSLR